MERIGNMKALLTGLWIIALCVSSRASITHHDIFVSGEDGYDTYRIPSIVATTNGTLLAVCEGRKTGRGDAGDIDLLIKRSFDNGRTWSGQQIIWDDGTNTCGNPCMVVDEQRGTIFLLSTWNRGDDHEKEILAGIKKDTRKVFVLESSDNGQSWSEPLDITADVKLPQWRWYATGPGVGIQLKTGEKKGRLVVPANHSFAAITPGVQFGSHAIYSDDHGQTWKLSDTVMPGFNENQIVELSDGKLLMNARNYRYRGSRCLAFSSDGGETWPYTAYESNLIEPRCQASILRYAPSGSDKSIILFSNPADNTKRINMSVKLSFDDAKTWPVAKSIYEGPSAYSCLTVLADGQIGCLYEKGEQMPYEKISLAIFTLDWLMGNNDRSDNAFFEWSNFTTLPAAASQDESLGVAGAFAGVSNGALIVGGGANFAKPYLGMDKQWHSDIWVLEKDGNNDKWYSGFNLDKPMGYGMSVTTPQGVVCIGGADAVKCYADVFMLVWDKTSKTISTKALPPLPRPCAFGGAAIIGSVIYVAGGMSDNALSSAMNNLWALDLSAKESGWKVLAPLPALARAFNVTVAQHDGKSDCVYVIGGRMHQDAANPKAIKFLNDAYKYSPASGQWEKCADLPKPQCAGTAAAVGQSHIFMFGGADGSLFFKADELKDNHPGFPKDIYAYHTITDQWIKAGQVPLCHVTSAVVKWDDSYLIVSGEVRPRVRTPDILQGKLKQ